MFLNATSTLVESSADVSMNESSFLSIKQQILLIMYNCCHIQGISQDFNLTTHWYFGKNMLQLGKMHSADLGSADQSVP